MGEPAEGQGEQDDGVRHRDGGALDHAGVLGGGLDGVGPGELPVRGEEVAPVAEGGDGVEDVADDGQADRAADGAEGASVFVESQNASPAVTSWDTKT